MKLYTEEQLRQMLEVCILSDKYPDVLTLNDVLKTQTPIQLPSDEEIEKHINYLKTCRQNLIDNANNMPQHLLEGGCMAFESAIDNANELFYNETYGGNK
jgi:hypothetical protein